MHLGEDLRTQHPLNAADVTSQNFIFIHLTDTIWELLLLSPRHTLVLFLKTLFYRFELFV